MSTAVHDELLRFALEKPEDEAMRERQELTARVYLDLTPKVKAEVIAEAVRQTAEVTRLQDARSAVREVLEHRKLALAAEDWVRLDACDDVATLKRWHAQAVDAPSAAEALR